MKLNFDAIARFWMTRKYLPQHVKQRIQANLKSCYISTQGTEYFIDPRHNHTEFMLWKYGALPEAKAIKFVISQLGQDDLTIIDVGANIGGFSIPILTSTNAKTNFFALEPQPVLLDRLKNNLRLNNISDATLLSRAISDFTGAAKFDTPNPKNLGQMQMQESRNQQINDAGTYFDVITMPDLIAHHKITQIDFLKVDVEGAEDRVIVPLLEAEPNILPKLIYFEVAHQKNWKYSLFEVLAKHGYQLSKDFGANQLFVLANWEAGS